MSRHYFVNMSVGEYYGIGRSFRRGVEFRDLNKRVPDPEISAIIFWRKVELSNGKRPRFSILEHYSDVVLVLDTSI